MGKIFEEDKYNKLKQIQFSFADKRKNIIVLSNHLLVYNNNNLFNRYFSNKFFY